MKELLDYCTAEAPAIRADIETLVRLESPSRDKAAVDRCGGAVADLLRDAGAAVTTLPQPDRGDHVRAEFAGGPGHVMVLGHFDTVWDIGTLERMPLREVDGRLHGPGIYDMKGSLVIAVHAARALRHLRLPMPRIVMLWTTDEEIGSDSSRATLEAEARDADAVLVVEPCLPGGAVKTHRKGCGEFTITARGVSAHAGIDPGKGASAIHELAHQVRVLESLQDLERGISLNVGQIRGGTRGNVIAEHAVAVVDVRVPAMADAARIEAAVRGLSARNPGVSLEIEGGVGRPPMERTAGTGRLYEQARGVAAVFGRDLGEGGTGGGSDGNFTSAIGVPTLDGLGPDGDGAHAVHEHVLLAELPWRAAFLAGLASRLNGVK